jgi:hypothetical protein
MAKGYQIWYNTPGKERPYSDDIYTEATKHKAEEVIEEITQPYLYFKLKEMNIVTV